MIPSYAQAARSLTARWTPGTTCPKAGGNHRSSSGGAEDSAPATPQGQAGQDGLRDRRGGGDVQTTQVPAHRHHRQHLRLLPRGPGLRLRVQHTIVHRLRADIDAGHPRKVRTGKGPLPDLCSSPRLLCIRAHPPPTPSPPPRKSPEAAASAPNLKSPAPRAHHLFRLHVQHARQQLWPSCVYASQHVPSWWLSATRPSASTQVVVGATQPGPHVSTGRKCTRLTFSHTSQRPSFGRARVHRRPQSPPRLHAPPRERRRVGSSRSHPPSARGLLPQARARSACADHGHTGAVPSRSFRNVEATSQHAALGAHCRWYLPASVRSAALQEPLLACDADAAPTTSQTFSRVRSPLPNAVTVVVRAGTRVVRASLAVTCFGRARPPGCESGLCRALLCRALPPSRPPCTGCLAVLAVAVLAVAWSIIAHE